MTPQGEELGDIFDALEDVSRRWLERGWPTETCPETAVAPVPGVPRDP